MAQVLLFQPETEVGHSLSPKEIRKEYGLSLLEAAIALGLSASALEGMERAPLTSEESLRRKYELFCGTRSSSGKNLIFGHYPLRVAREILQLTVDEMAARFGYTGNSWRRIEANARPLSADTIRAIERQVRERFSTICGPI